MKKYIITVAASLVIILAVAGVALASSAVETPSSTVSGAPQSAPAAQDDQEGCLACHEGIEDIVDPASDMGKQILAQGACTTCHGGDASVTDDADAAHEVDLEGTFYPDPGSPTVANKTCGRCHLDYNYAMERSLMNTEAGKIQGNLWAWGVHGEYGEERAHVFGNYTIDDEDGPTPIFGTDTYKAYMEALIAAYPDQMPSHMDELPNPTVEEIIADPSLAAFTYQRNQCQRCHVGTPPRSKRGDWRGMGCSSCHIPYSNEGYYEGGDPTIPLDEPGHMLRHSIQGTRETGGIPVETCNSCHNRGKRIGVSFEGIMEFPYGTPTDESGSGQPKLHTKKYLYIKDDLHHDPISRDGNPEGGMLCQDCHTSIDMHGDGNLFGTTLAQVEIECSDCHGETDAYPWELPIGYGEELLAEMSDEPRGTAERALIMSSYGTTYDAEDGYLLTARGNPFGNVIRRGDEVVVHSATGRDYTVPTLKGISLAGTWSSPDAQVAMETISAHKEELECYACHADWAPQCYGCHVTADYTEGNTGTDWVAVGNSRDASGVADTSLVLDGKISEGRSYLRWEDPILGINGEGRVTPLIPGCQVFYTVIGPDGENVVNNMIGHTLPGEEGGGDDGQRGIDMAPAQPHTVGREARKCESCHSDPKALGYGIGGGKFLNGYDEGFVIDLRNNDGSIMPNQYQTQIPAIPDLPMDLTQIVDPETGEQMQTVGSHWPASGPLTADQRERMERTGVCMGCHIDMADTAFWNDQVVAKYGEIISNDDHINMMNQLMRDAVAGPEVVEVEAEAADDGSVEALAAAEEQAQNLEIELAESEAALADAEAELANAEATVEAMPEEAPAEESGGGSALPVILALIGGLLVGAGGMFAMKKK
ncbi:MAG: cytochrome C [Chloroflexi bacterium]|nr:cytochrome C [Chloroflexota bacterium]